MKHKLPIVIIVIIIAVSMLGVWLWHNRQRHYPAQVEHPIERKTMLSKASTRKVSTNAQHTAIPTPAFTLSKTPRSVQSILDFKNNFVQRDTKARSLGRSLNPSEMKALSDFLLQRHTEDENDMGRAIKNDLMDALCEQRLIVSTNVVAMLQAVFIDSSQDIVVRDYALQHLGVFYERLAIKVPWTREQVEAQRTAIQQSLWAALGETDSSIAGTALLALSRLAQTEPEFDRARIGKVALKMGEDRTLGELTRVTALQICGQLQVRQALPLLAQVAENEPDMSLRISAIGSIGSCGGSRELGLLKKIAGEGNSRLEPAAILAMKRVEQRLGQP